MSVKAQEKMQVKGVKKNNNTSLLKRITCLALASLSLTSLSACDYKNNTPTDIPTTSVEIPAEIPELTEITIETPEPTPTPIEFSYENVFSEIFSDEALAELYPDIKDYARERERIYSNISRIEDFEFYELTEEEQEFIKEAQLGNIDSSKETELREVLTKIVSNDPYVFDDVDNEVKIDNRVNNLIPEFEKLDLGIDETKLYTFIKKTIIVSNCGNMENISTEASSIMMYISAGMMMNNHYFYETVLPDYKSNNWKGNYSVLDSSKFLLDGSEGQKIAKKLYEANVKFFNSKKEDVENGLKEIVEECLNILLVNDSLQKLGGINSIDSKVHYTSVYDYCCYIIISFSGSMMNDNITYSVSNEYAEKIGLLITELSVRDINAIMGKYLGSAESIYSQAFDELEEAQKKYGNQNITIVRFKEE